MYHPGHLRGALGEVSLRLRRACRRGFPHVVDGDEQLVREVVHPVFADGHRPALNRARAGRVRLVQTPPRVRQLQLRDVQTLPRQRVSLLQPPLKPRQLRRL